VKFFMGVLSGAAASRTSIAKNVAGPLNNTVTLVPSQRDNCEEPVTPMAELSPAPIVSIRQCRLILRTNRHRWMDERPRAGFRALFDVHLYQRW